MALEAVLQHLTSAQQQQAWDLPAGEQKLNAWHTWRVDKHKEQQQLPGGTTARALHPVSKRLRQAVATCRTHASLQKYLQRDSSDPCPTEAAPTADVVPRAIPWDFLAAAPAISSISLDLQQVPALLAGPKCHLVTLTQRLKILQVLEVRRTKQDSSSFTPRLEGLAHLLARCTGLQALSVRGRMRSRGTRQLMGRCLLGATDRCASSSSPGAAAGAATAEDAVAGGEVKARDGTSSLPPSPPSSAAAAGSSRSGLEQAPAPLLHLELQGWWLTPFAGWLQQREQQGQLQRLDMKGPCAMFCNGSMKELTALTGLQQLTLEHQPWGAVGAPEWNTDAGEAPPTKLPQALAALSSSLTQLCVKGFAVQHGVAAAVGSLQQLRRLELVGCSSRGPKPLRCSWLTGLRQLTHLDLSSNWLQPLPANLGQALPGLEVLVVAGCDVKQLPRGLTRLTHLDAARNPDICLESVSKAAALRVLDLSGNQLQHLCYLAPLSQLKVLVVREPPRPTPSDELDSFGDEEEEESGSFQGHHPHWDPSSSSSDGDSSNYSYSSSSSGGSSNESDHYSYAALAHLPNLRHLDLSNGDWRAAHLQDMLPLRHLTLLDLSSALGPRYRCIEAGRLISLGVLPALQQLNLAYVGVGDDEWEDLGIWLVRQPDLTRLSLRRTTTEAPWDTKTDHISECLGRLPTQLVELDIRNCMLQELPDRISEMTNLRVLLADDNAGDSEPYLELELPSWLTRLQQLEVLAVESAQGHASLQVLLQLPRLKLLHVASGDDPGDPGGLLRLRQQLQKQRPHLTWCPAYALSFVSLFGEPKGLKHWTA